MFFEILCRNKPLRFEKSGVHKCFLSGRGKFLDSTSEGVHNFSSFANSLMIFSRTIVVRFGQQILKHYIFHQNNSVAASENS